MINDTKYIACSFYTGFSLRSPFTRAQTNALIIFLNKQQYNSIEKDIFLTPNSMMHSLFINWVPSSLTEGDI